MLPFYNFVFLLYSAVLCNIVVVKTPKPNYKKDFKKIYVKIHVDYLRSQNI